MSYGLEINFLKCNICAVEGICDNSLDAGVYSIEVNVGNCISHYTQPTRFISGGFNSPSRLHVTEVRTDKKVDACKYVTFKFIIYGHLFIKFIKFLCSSTLTSAVTMKER